MRETRADTTQAFVYAIALHVLLFALMFLGLWWTRTTAPQSAAGSPIEAELIDPDALSARMKRALAQRPEPVAPQPEPEPEPVAEDSVPPPQPIPEPLPDESLVEQQVQAQERVPEPDSEQQEEVRRDAISAETREREQEEKRREEQIDLTERERQREAEERQRLARQQEREEKLKQIRAERAKLQRQTQMAEQRLKQIADRQAMAASEAAAQSDAEASATPPPGNNGVDEGLLRQYMAAIQSAVTSKWTRPDNMPGLPCKMRIVQLPGGEVMSVQFDASCPYDEAGKRSVEAAVLKAQPLPYAGFESVFNRRLNFTFRPN